MIHSMTGYGRVVKDMPGKKVTIEVRTLNSKQFDLNVRIPSYYREKELDMRNLIGQELKRGKIDFAMYVELVGESTNSTINEPVYKAYFNQLSRIYDGMGMSMPNEAISGILRLPDVMMATHEELDEEEWKKIGAFIVESLEQCNSYRRQEGKAMHTDLQAHIANIKTLLTELGPIEKRRIEAVKERISNRLEEFIDPEKIDQNRFEQELLFFIEKLDVNEEMVRLENHCQYFLDTMEEPGAVGKKLGFISQEIGREINTLGSKASEATMQKLVVRMKDELEKIKEQALNIL